MEEENRFKITGTITTIYELVVKSARFRRREFCIRFTDQDFKNKIVERTIKFSLLNEHTEIADDMQVDDQVTVGFYIDGRDYEKDGITNNFTSLAAYKVEFLEKSVRKPKQETSTDELNQSIDDAFDDYSIFDNPEKAVQKEENKGKVDQGESNKEEGKKSGVDEFDDLPF